MVQPFEVWLIKYILLKKSAFILLPYNISFIWKHLIYIMSVKIKQFVGNPDHWSWDCTIWSYSEQIIPEV